MREIPCRTKKEAKLQFGLFDVDQNRKSFRWLTLRVIQQKKKEMQADNNSTKKTGISFVTF